MSGLGEEKWKERKGMGLVRGDWKHVLIKEGLEFVKGGWGEGGECDD